MRIKEIHKFVESLNVSEAHYCYGYLKGFFDIEEKEIEK